jgi:hypothetical protein
MASPMAKWAGRSMPARTASQMSCFLVDEDQKVDATEAKAFNEVPMSSRQALGFVQCALSNICSKSRAMAAVQVGATALIPKIETVGISKIKSCRRAIYGGENEVAVPIDQ